PNCHWRLRLFPLFPPTRHGLGRASCLSQQLPRSVTDMRQHLTKRSVRAMVPDAACDLLVYDDEVTGFGIYRNGNAPDDDPGRYTDRLRFCGIWLRGEDLNL